MLRTSFNDEWAVKPKESLFAAVFGGSVPVPVSIPHDAIRDLDRSADAEGGSHTGFHPGGEFEYEKTFVAPEEWRDQVVAIEFEGVYRDAGVFINGDLIAQQPNGYSGFVVPIDGHVKYGEPNRITVEARSHDDSRWYTGAGIYRDTWLLTGPVVHVVPDGVRVVSSDVDDEQAVVTADVTVQNAARHVQTVRVSTTITDIDGTVVASATTPLTLSPSSSAVARLRHFVSEPRLWSADSPHLYDVLTTLEGDLGDDQAAVRHGIRTLQLDPLHGLRVNGDTVLLRGAGVHHDNGLLGSATIPRAERRRVEILRANGYNAIRSAHNPISRAMLEACDELGMYVMDELSDVWTASKNSYDYALSFPQWWEHDVEAMVTKDFNHPSVIMYSIGNEIMEIGQPLGAAWGRKLADRVRLLDPTRYITNAINGVVAGLDTLRSAGRDSEENSDVNDAMVNMAEAMSALSASPLVTARTEEAHAQLDVSGLNYAQSRYEMDGELFPNRIIVGSETFPSQLDEIWPLVERLPHVIGDFAWTGWDYLGEVGIGRTVRKADEGDTRSAPYPWLLAQAGTIDITGRPRAISQWRATVWGQRTSPFIIVERPEYQPEGSSTGPWGWTDGLSTWSWDLKTGTVVAVEVYSDADEVELILNDRSLARRRVGEEKAFVASFTVPFEPGALTAVAFVGGEEFGRSALTSGGGPSGLSVTVERPEISAVGGDLAYVNIVVVDAKGTPVLDRNVDVSITIEGAGTLAGLGTGRPDPTDRFDASSCTTFDGHALAIIRPVSEGTIVVTASAEGLGTGTATLVAL